MKLSGVILLLILQATIYSQNTDRFERFLEAFESHETRKEIPVETSVAILGSTLIKDEYNVQGVEAEQIFNFGDIIGYAGPY